MPVPLLYPYSADGLYLGEPVEARWSPKDLVEGREVPIVPAYTTLVAVPELTEQQLARFSEETQQWTVEDAPLAITFDIVTSARLLLDAFTQEVRSQYPTAEVTITPNEAIESLTEKTVHINYVSASESNILGITALVNAHNYAVHKLTWVRGERTARISSTEWIRSRHEDELKLIAAGELSATTLTAQQFLVWLFYWQSLRDFPENCDPLNIVWPVEPV